MAELEFSPPKYAQIVSSVQHRIQDGTYPLGALLPSETQLVREFGVSRPTVVRALQVLQSQGWIDREHGRGSFVRNRAVVADQPRPGRAFLDEIEGGAQSSLLHVGREPSPSSVATLLRTPAGTPALLRRRLIEREGQPSELVSSWFPVDVAEGNDLGQAQPLPGGIYQHLHAVKRLRFRPRGRAGPGSAGYGRRGSAAQGRQAVSRAESAADRVRRRRPAAPGRGCRLARGS